MLWSDSLLRFKLSHSLWSQGCYNCHWHLRQPGKGSGVKGISHMPWVTYWSFFGDLAGTRWGKGGGDLSGWCRHRDHRAFKIGSWTKIVHHDACVWHYLMAPAFWHSVATSTRQRKILLQSPKRYCRCFQRETNSDHYSQTATSLFLCLHTKSRTNEISFFPFILEWKHIIKS